MHKDTAERIEADFTRLCDALSQIPAPRDHRWEASPRALSWFCGDVLLSTRHGASIFLRREPYALHDPFQVHVEARVFWAGLPGLAYRADPYSAILWCEQGSRIATDPRRHLLGERAYFPKAGTLDDLIASLVELLTAAFSTLLSTGYAA